MPKSSINVELNIYRRVGLRPLSKTGAELLFEVFSRRYERSVTPVISHLPFNEWTEAFGSERLTGALLGRLPQRRPRASKLDPFKTTITEELEKDATVSATVMQQRLRPLGSAGGDTILRAHLQRVRRQTKPTSAFVRIEPAHGEHFRSRLGALRRARLLRR
jgi:hypothetical protein